MEESEPNLVVSTGNLGQGGRVIAEASGLAPAPAEPVQTTQVSPGQDEGLRVVSETVTGPSADQLAMGVAGKLQIEFSGESWVEVRDARGRLILADLMTPENGVDRRMGQSKCWLVQSVRVQSSLMVRHKICDKRHFKTLLGSLWELTRIDRIAD